MDEMLQHILLIKHSVYLQALQAGEGNIVHQGSPREAVWKAGEATLCMDKRVRQSKIWAVPESPLATRLEGAGLVDQSETLPLMWVLPPADPAPSQHLGTTGAGSGNASVEGCPARLSTISQLLEWEHQSSYGDALQPTVLRRVHL